MDEDYPRVVCNTCLQTSEFNNSPPSGAKSENSVDAQSESQGASDLDTTQNIEGATTSDNNAEDPAANRDDIVDKPAVIDNGLLASAALGLAETNTNHEPTSQSTNVDSGLIEDTDNHEREEVPSLSGANLGTAAVVKEDHVAAEAQGDKEEEVEPERWVAGDTFLALISFFNAIAHDTLKPTDGNRRKLPTETTEMILGHVMDLETYHACTNVSTVFRNICLERPFLIDVMKLLKLLPKATETLEHEVRFLAVDLTGRQFDIN
ncbi:MAG: hypothetical protein LQ339_007325, partial [Xanthoria mediterranea]